ncbi:MAG: hypothetical protein IPM39_25480 [Chloroflexi bacterium]|nr:hypothetical protein [Chloroflexota bacterium]
MNEEERWAYLVTLDEELLQGSVILSEWCSFIVREADTAFAHGAYLASILTAVAGIETYLRAEYANSKRSRLYDLIEDSPIDEDLKTELHTIRRFRNQWVHVDQPWEDAALLEFSEMLEDECENMALRAVHILRRTIYENPSI